MKFGPKCTGLKKIDHEPITLYDIWLPNRIPSDINPKKGNRFMILGSYKKFTHMKTMYLFSNYITWFTDDSLPENSHRRNFPWRVPPLRIPPTDNSPPLEFLPTENSPPSGEFTTLAGCHCSIQSMKYENALQA